MTDGEDRTRDQILERWVGVTEHDPRESVSRQLVWEFFKEFEGAERHFNNLQSQYRTLASTWLLAAFTGIGFIVTQPQMAVPIDRLLLITGIGVAATVGITLLWNLDIRVYHLLMFEYFMAGHSLEERHTWLPPVRTNIRETMKAKKVTQRAALFYIAANCATLGTAGLALASWAYRYSPRAAAIVVAFWLASIVAIGRWMLHAAENVTKSATSRQSTLRKFDA